MLPQRLSETRTKQRVIDRDPIGMVNTAEDRPDMRPTSYGVDDSGPRTLGEARQDLPVLGADGDGSAGKMGFNRLDDRLHDAVVDALQVEHQLLIRSGRSE